mgnify:FL=1
MLPTIKRVRVPYKDGGKIIQWVVEGKHGWDVCDTFYQAIRRWFNIVFSSKKNERKIIHTPPQFNTGKYKAIAKRRKKNRNKKTHR